MKKVVILFLMMFSAAVLFAEENKTSDSLTFELPAPVFGMEEISFFNVQWFDYKTQQCVNTDYINSYLITVPEADSYLKASKTFKVISAIFEGAGIAAIFSSYFIDSKKAKDITRNLGVTGFYLGGMLTIPANRFYTRAVDEYNRKVLGLYRK